IAPARRIVIIAMLFTLCIVLSVCATLANTAMMQGIEDIICRRVHGPGFPRNETAGRDVDDPCKDDAIAGEIAMILGWDGVFNLLPSIFLAVPFGAVADRYGRVPVIGLVLMGVVLQIAWIMFVCLMDGALDVRYVWAANLASFVGGGQVVFTSMLYTMVADISTDAQRTTLFLYIGTVVMGGSLAAHPLTYLAMQVGTWFTFKISLLCAIIAALLAFWIPETLDRTAAREVDPVPFDADQTALNKVKLTILDRILASASTAATHTLRTVRWLFWEQKLVGLLFASLACEIMGKSVNDILQQYISKRHRITFAEASLFETISLVTVMVALLVILPLLSHILQTRLGWSARAKDLRLAQLSALLTAAGCLLIGLASTLPLLSVAMVTFSLGVGYTFMIRGLMTSLVGGKDIALLYSTIAVVDSLSIIIGLPMFSWLFKVGMGWGPAWVGLPFLVAGAILVGAAVFV
ncbi:major facilitator superfamily domain-containing protein, partial [Schizothecium vesticola]